MSRKRIAKIILINIFLLFFLSLTIDLMKGPPHYLGERHIVLRDWGEHTDLIIKPAMDHVQNSDGIEVKEYRLRTDEDGFIIGDDNHTNKDSTVDIFFWWKYYGVCVR